MTPRRDGRAVDGDGLENRCTRKGIGGSNPSPSATLTPFVWRSERSSGAARRMAGVATGHESLTVMNACR